MMSLPMTAWVFVITRRDSRTVVGAGLIALEARYVAASYFGAHRLDRRFATVAQWREIRHAFSVGIATSPLSPASPLVAVLLGDNIMVDPLLEPMVKVYEQYGRSVVALQEVAIQSHLLFRAFLH